MEGRLESVSHWVQAPVLEIAQKPLILSVDTPIAVAVASVQDPQVHCLVIQEENGIVAGIFTEEDALNRVLGHDNPEHATVADFMEKDFISVSENSTISEAIDQMGQKRLHYLVICNDSQQATGILSIRCLVDFIAKVYQDADVLTQESELEKALSTVVHLPMSFVLTAFGRLDCLRVSSHQAVSSVEELFSKKHANVALVYENNHLCGLLRTRDLPYKVLLRDPEVGRLPVSDFMGRIPESISEESEILEALKKMSNSMMLYLVFRSGEQLGVISSKNVFSYIYSHIHDDE